MYYQFGAVLIFLIFGVAFVFGNLLIGVLFRRVKPTAAKNSIYECGEPTIGSAWIRYNSRFYNVALVYLLFDVEVVVLIPALLVYREQVVAGFGAVTFWSLFVFLVLLALGLVYEWFYGNLDWIKKDELKPNSGSLAA